ncbi:MAG: hypothetical protein HY791_13515 [Deltaproteobacteria bacterium]|nr:hypothetical protein [Deltaproteobacteria bacterium]
MFPDEELFGADLEDGRPEREGPPVRPSEPAPTRVDFVAAGDPGSLDPDIVDPQPLLDRASEPPPTRVESFEPWFEPRVSEPKPLEPLELFPPMAPRDSEAPATRFDPRIDFAMNPVSLQEVPSIYGPRPAPLAEPLADRAGRRPRDDSEALAIELIARHRSISTLGLRAPEDLGVQQPMPTPNPSLTPTVVPVGAESVEIPGIGSRLRGGWLWVVVWVSAAVLVGAVAVLLAR